MSIGDWMASPKGKKIIGVVYSLGAAVVIMGALFKIMHWPGASVVLTFGMLTECVLFMIGAFDKPHKETDWSLVFPELAHGDEEEGAEKAHAAHGGAGTSVKAKMTSIEVAPIAEEDMKKLSESIQRLSDNASQLANFSSASAVTETYIKNLSSASEAVTTFASSQKGMLESSSALIESYKSFATNMSAISTDSKEFMGQMSKLNETLGAVNSTYELQLKGMNTQTAAFANVSSSLEQINAVMEASIKETEEYKAQTAKLTQQVSSLNNIYGNMLNAMSTR